MNDRIEHKQLKAARTSNFELLRIVSMCLIVAGHFLNQGGV